VVDKAAFGVILYITVRKKGKHDMAKLLIATQVYENYGAHAWDGTGECPQYWKAKGGNDYVVKDFKDFLRAAEVVDSLRSEVEEDNDYYREHIIDWEIVEDSHLTSFEQSQLDYDGKIDYPAKELTLKEIV
jgi:hypothetical protein